MGATRIPPVGADKDLPSIGSGMPFARRGCWFGIYADSAAMMISGQSLYIGSRRGSSAERADNVIIHLYPARDGRKIDYGYYATATELVLRGEGGEIRCCYADGNLLLIKGTGGLSLKLEQNLRTHEMMKKRGKNAWEQVSHAIGTMVYVPLKGSIDMKADWEWDTLSTPQVRGTVLPDENGEFLLAAEESLYGGVLRDSYPDYDSALADVRKDWSEYHAAFPPLSGELAELGEEAIWTLWSYIAAPAGRSRYPLIFMTMTAMASAWQMIQNAVAMQDNVPLRNGFLMNMLDETGPRGQFPDGIDDARANHQGLKPPIQGWGLKWIMKRHDLKKEIPAEDLERIYRGYGAWADWFMTYRDDDHDGLPEHEHGDDTGFDDSTVFLHEPEVEGPDLPSYLAILMEALGDLADILGKPAEAEAWRKRSKEMIDLLIRELWNGELFIARSCRTHAPIVTGSLLHYTPLILGKRLPQEIIDRMTADLLKEGEFLSISGLASEKMTGQQFRVSGMARGFVLPPYQLFILTGMYDAGKVEEAKLIARRYCLAMKTNGFNMIINPVKPGFTGFGCTWPACVYLILADMVENM